MQVFQQMIIFLLLMLVGAMARRKNILTEENQPQITKLIVNIAYPAIILSGATGASTHVEGRELLLAFGVVLVLLVLLILSGRFLARVLGFAPNERGVVEVMVIFTNIGFMGVPMIDGIYGKDALIYMTILLIPFNLLFYSYVMQRIKGTGTDAQPFTWKSLLNTGMGACVLAILLYLSRITLPYVLSESIHMLGSMTAPLAMMLLGSFLLETDWKSMFHARMLIFTFLKMLVLPIAIVLFFEQFLDNTYLLATVMATAATPSGNVIPLLAALYNKEAYPVSVDGIALTTAVAVVTMPIVALVVGL